MSIKQYFLFAFLLCMMATAAGAQTRILQRPDPGQLRQDTTNRKFTLHGEENQIIDARVQPPIQYLNGNVKVFHAGTFMFCDTAIIRGPILRMRHNVAMLQNDTIRLFADSLVYNADSLLAYLYGDIIMENGSKRLYTSKLSYHLGTKTARYNENALLEQDSSQVLSQRGTYFVEDKLVIFKDDVTVTGKDFLLTADSLGFETDTQAARFLAPTRIVRDTVEIYAEKGWFDLDDKKGDFIQNAQYRSGKSYALADTIFYDGAMDKVRLSSCNGLSRYVSESDSAIAKVITYDKKNELYELQDSVYYKSKENEVTGSYVEYNKKTEVFKTKGRATVSDPPMLITADTLDYTKLSKRGIANGQVIWRDTAANTTIYADHVRYRGQENYMLAYNTSDVRPYFTTEIDTGLMHMRADTFKSIRILKTIDSIQTDTIDLFTGFNDVRVYKEDLQLVCDSLTYNTTDSVFTFYNNPILWSDTTQITGDTMLLFMKNKVMDKLLIRENGTILSSGDLVYFDQVQGRTIDANFEKGRMKKMRVDGDAQVIYYLKDDTNSYIGVNQSRSSFITFRMEDNKMTDIFFYIDVKSKVLPMTTNHESLKIKNFVWKTEERPKSKDDL